MKAAGAMPEVAAELHEQCNPMLPPSELSGADPEKVFDGLEGKCGQDEAEELRAALDASAYSYEAVIPDPYMHPPMMEQVFRIFNHSELVTAISHASDSLDGKLQNTDLATLVKFFAWGWPVNSNDLRNALGGKAVEALQRCRLVMPCGKVPSHWISTLMVYPVPQTSAIVATDWGKRSVSKSQELPVSTVTLESLGLMHNAPDVRDKHVLDFTLGGGGVQAVVAAQRGATSVSVLEAGPRAARVARFNAWMNGVSSQVWVGTLEEAGELTPPFDVLLGSAKGSYLQVLVGSGSTLLGSKGAFAFSTDISDPKELAKELCAKGAIASTGFEGKIIHEPSLPSGNENTHKLLESIADGNYFAGSGGAGASTEGLIFGWRNSQAQCKFDQVELPKPMGYTFGNSSDRACYWSHLGCPLS